MEAGPHLLADSRSRCRREHLGLYLPPSPVFSPDDSYQPTSDELEARKEGLPEKYHDSLLGVSRAHPDYLTSQAKRQYENEKLIWEAGWMGIGVSLAAGMLDPTDIAIGLASGGSGCPCRRCHEAGPAGTDGDCQVLVLRLATSP